MAHLASYLTLFAIVVFLLGGTVHIFCFSSGQAFNLKVHIRPAPSGNAFYATSLPILERPLALNNHVTHGGLPIPLSSALSLPAYTNFLTAVRIFTDAVDASAGGAVVPCEDLQGERASFYTSNYKLSDILALLDGSGADHLLIYLSTPTSKSRELVFEQRVRVAGELVPVRFQAFISTNQSTVWASPPPVPLRADEVARVREQWAASYEKPNWFLDQVPDDSEAAEGAPPSPWRSTRRAPRPWGTPASPSLRTPHWSRQRTGRGSCRRRHSVLGLLCLVLVCSPACYFLHVSTISRACLSRRSTMQTRRWSSR